MIYILCYGEYNPEKPRVGKIAKSLEKIDEVTWVVSKGKENNVISLNSKNKLEYAIKAKKLRKKIKDNDILFGYMHIGALASFLIEKGIFWYDYPDPWKGWYYYKSKEDNLKWKIGRKLFYFLEKKMYAKAKFVTTASPAQLEFLKSQHGNKKNLEVILNCPDLRIFNPQNIDEELKIENENVLIHIGYIGREYGADILIKALKIIKGEEKDVKLFFLGDCPDAEYKKYLKNLIAKNNLDENIVFTKVPYTKVPHYLNIAKIGYIAFRDRFYNHIGGANKLFEYMACGLGIVSSEMWGFKMLVKEEKNVLFAKPESPKDFAEKTIMLLQDKTLLNEIRKNNITLAEEKYNWSLQEKKIKRIVKILRC